MRFLPVLMLIFVIVAGSLIGCGGGGGRPQSSNESIARIQSIELCAHDMVYNPTDGRIYASVAYTGGPYSNLVVAIDPSTATVTASVNAGNYPYKLALSRDGETLYVAINAAVQQISLPSMTLGQRIDLGSDEFFGPLRVEDIAVSPADSGIIAISLMCWDLTPRHRGVVIYDNGVRRPTATSGLTGSNVIEFADDPTLLYGYDNETTDYGFRRMRVTSEGVSVVDVTYNLIQRSGADIIYANGLIFSSSGRVINPEMLQVLRRKDEPNGGKVMAMDVAGHRFFAIDNSARLRWYDAADFCEAGEGFLPYTYVDNCTCMTCFGDSGVAVGSDQRVYLVTVGRGN